MVEIYEDEGFQGYVPTTIDPGTSLLIGTIAICILLNAILPCLVSFGRHQEERQKLKKEGSNKEKNNEWAVDHADGDDHEAKAESISDMSHSVRFPLPMGLSIASVKKPSPSIASFGKASVLSVNTHGASSVADHSLVSGILVGGKRHRQRRFRKALEKRALLDETGAKAASFFKFDRMAAPAYHPPAQYPYYAGGERHPTDEDDAQSFLSKMDTDAVSVKSFTMDGQHEDFVPKQFIVQEEGDDDIDITCCGTTAWWKFKWVLRCFDRIVALSEWDFEMRRIMKLTLPFAIQALFTGALDVMVVGIIGNFLGTREVAAYVVVDTLVSLTNEFVGGFWNALTTLCSQAAGAKQNKLCGQYVQMAILLYILFSIPFMYLWWYKTYDAVLWFGFDEAAAEIGSEFAKVYIFAGLVEGIAECIHGLLDVIDLENYSTVIGCAEDIAGFVAILQVAMFGQPELYHIGLIHLAAGLSFLILNISIILFRGWFKPYLPGLIGSFSLTNYKAVWLMCKTSLALSLGFLLTDGEWEILTVLASFAGPAEVAAWGLIGAVWDVAEDLIEAIADAAEVRCAFLLGCGKPVHAQVSSYKSMLIATITSFLVTSILFIMGEDLATWLTADPVLQELLVELLPLFGVGNITMTIGNVAWTLLGSQGRYRLATIIAFCGSWLVTLPLAVLASVAFNLSLQGQTAAVVIGYMVSGTINAYLLFRSDWEKLSLEVIESHEMEQAIEKTIKEVKTLALKKPEDLKILDSDGESLPSVLVPPERVASGFKTP